MDRRLSHRVLGVIAGVLVLLSLAVGGTSQYLAIQSLDAAVGKHAYGKPFGAGTREFKPQGVYVGQVVGFKIYALPTQEMDVPGWQSRYVIRRETADGKVYEAYYSDELFDLRDDPPASPVTGGFPPLEFLDIVRQNT